jgi:hypothetical protein
MHVAAGTRGRYSELHGTPSTSRRVLVDADHVWLCGSVRLCHFWHDESPCENCLDYWYDLFFVFIYLFTALSGIYLFVYFFIDLFYLFYLFFYYSRIIIEFILVANMVRNKELGQWSEVHAA